MRHHRLGRCCGYSSFLQRNSTPKSPEELMFMRVVAAPPLRSFEEGCRADLAMSCCLKKSAPPGAKRKRDSAQPQERSNQSCNMCLTSRADSKVAWHLLDRRSAPSSKEGISFSKISARHMGPTCKTSSS